MESVVEESELVQLLKKLEEYVMNLRRVNFVLNTEQENEELISIKGSLFEIIGLTKGQLLNKIDALTSIERLTAAEVPVTTPKPTTSSECSQPSSSIIPPPLQSFGLNSDAGVEAGFNELESINVNAQNPFDNITSFHQVSHYDLINNFHLIWKSKMNKRLKNQLGRKRRCIKQLEENRLRDKMGLERKVFKHFAKWNDRK